MKECILVKGLCKSYIKKSEKLKVLENINFIGEAGELITFVGSNGVGKTTLIRILAGILRPDKGKVLINGDDPKIASLNGKIGYVPQNYKISLFDWLTNIDNVTFPLKLKGIPRKERYRCALDLINKLEMGLSKEELGISDQKRYPYELSGGQQQKVVIARALIYEPYVLLMDEPFSALDIETRPKMQDYILKIWERTKITVIFISHDIEEATYLGDKIFVLKGRPVQGLKVFKNPLPRPRTIETKRSNKFIEFRKRIEESVFEENV